MIYLKHLSVQRRGSWWHWIHSFQVPGKPGAFSVLIKSTGRYCRLLPIWCGKVLPCCMRNMITDLWGALDTKNITLSSLTAGTAVVCHISCLYPETYLLQATADKDFRQRDFQKEVLFKQKYCCPKFMITVLPKASHLLVQWSHYSLSEILPQCSEAAPS